MACHLSGYFAALGVPILSGRDFNDLDGQIKDKDPVVIISETLANRMFPHQDPLNRHVYWTDPVLKFVPGISAAPHRIIGVTADFDDEHVVPEPTLTVYSSFEEGPMYGGRLLIHTDRSLFAGHADHAGHSRPVRRPAHRACGHSRRKC